MCEGNSKEMHFSPLSLALYPFYALMKSSKFTILISWHLANLHKAAPLQG